MFKATINQQGPCRTAMALQKQPWQWHSGLNAALQPFVAVLSLSDSCGG